MLWPELARQQRLTGQLRRDFMVWRPQRRRRDGEESERANGTSESWTIDSGTFGSVMAAPWGHSARLCGGKLQQVSLWCPGGLKRTTTKLWRIYLCHVCFRRVCVRVCVCVVGIFSIRQQEGFTDCVWVGGRNSRGLNHVSVCNTHSCSHTHSI